MNQLTVKQALEEGYTHFVYANDGYQAIKSIEEYSKSGDIDFTREDIRLVDKTPFHPTGLSNDAIQDLLADTVAVNHHDYTGDDTDAVFDAIKEIDFSDVEERIQVALNGLNYYHQTNIKLVP